MPYALVTDAFVRPEPREGRRLNPRRLRGYDESACTFVVLDPGDKRLQASGVALAYYETPISDRKADTVADDKAEGLAVASRAKLAARLGGREFKGDPFNQQVAALLKARGLRPHFERSRYEIWLGPRANRLFYTEAATVQKHSKAWVDNFNRANAQLHASTLSGGGATWTEFDTLNAFIVSNRVRITTTSALNGGAFVGTDTDTDDAYAQAAVPTWTLPTAGGIYRAIFVSGTNDSSGFAGDAVTGSNGYAFTEENFDGDPFQDLFAISQDISLDSDTNTPAAGTIYVSRSGSTIEGKFNGATVLGPSTDNGEATGAGNRRVGFFADLFSSDASTATIEWEDLIGGDIVAATAAFPFLRHARRGAMHGFYTR